MWWWMDGISHRKYNIRGMGQRKMKLHAFTIWKMNGHCHSCVSDAIDIRRVFSTPFFLVEKKNIQN